MTNRILGAACLCASLFVFTGCPTTTPGNADGGNGTKDACTPSCTDKVCGDDGCGGTCAPGCTTDQTCENGACKCVPKCDGKVCGDDGCGGSCAPGCAGNQECTAEGTCQIKICIPDCANKDCGTDGCGGFCGDNRGSCPEGKACSVNSKCELCTAQCEAGQECGEDAFKCSCGSCQPGFECKDKKCATCTPKCDGKQCGDDGCGGTCGTCSNGTGCSAENKCVTCTPGAECAGKACGTDLKGCSCGTCTGGKFCQRDGTCEICPDTGGSVTIDTLCTKLNNGLHQWAAWSYQMCGMDINDADPGQLNSADIDHFDAEFWQYASYGYVYPVGPYNEVHNCQYWLKEPYEALKASAKAGNVCFDSKAVDQCIQAGIDLKKQGLYGNSEPEVCQKFFVANTDESKACSYQWECKTGMYCKPTDDKLSCGGVCAKPLPLGSACTPNDQCEKDTACGDDGTGAIVCVSLPKDGEACPDFECVTGFVCSYDDGGICVAEAKEGESCKLIDEYYGYANCTGNLSCVDATGAACATGGTCTCVAPAAPAEPGKYGDTCDDTKPCGYCLYCNPDTSKCEKPTKIGDACVTISGQPAPLCVDAFGLQECVTDETAGTSTCLIKPREGVACSVDPTEVDKNGDPVSMYIMRQGNCMYALDNFCKRTAFDGSGVCSALPKEGEPCNDAFDMAPYCAGGYCKGFTPPSPTDGTGRVDGTCVPYDNDGTDCETGDLCESGLCVKDSMTGTGKCGQPAKATELCAEDFAKAGDFYCDDTSYCAEQAPDFDGGYGITDAGVAIKGPMYCYAKKAGGEACENADQCLTGACSKDKVCNYACGASIGADTSGCGDYTGFNWWSKFIFVSGTLVFFGLRRRRFPKQ
jgi:hypothetical protein